MKPIAALLTTLALGLTGCTGPSEPVQPGRIYVLWADISRSIKQTDIQRWQTAVETKLLPKIACGDRIVLLPIQKDSTAAAPLLDWSSDGLDDDPTKSELFACRKAQAELKRHMATLFHDLVETTPSAGWTDILGTLDRFEGLGLPQSNRHRVVVVYLSDMQNANRELNFEKLAITEDKIGPLTDQIITRHQKAIQSWDGVIIRCWLNAAGPDVAPPLNAQPVLKSFYQTLFSKTGSVLEEFQSL